MVITPKPPNHLTMERGPIQNERWFVMAGMKTITGKNQKARLIETAHNMTVYSLDNYFNGESRTDEEAKRILQTNLDRFAGHPRMAKIRLMGPGKYWMKIHSNLWFEFEGSHES